MQNMYQFVDTAELPMEDPLPAEALKINGEWIENQIDGYRTLHVSGRELMNCEIDDLQAGISNGMKYKRKRYPARMITVTYQLSAETPAAFRAAYNKLNKLLNVENAKLIFHDEEDKYFIGTKAGNSEVSPGANHVTGEIEFYCADPFKYSVDPVFLDPDSPEGDVFEFDYTGSFPAYPVLTADFPGDCGYVAFVDQKGHILQFGNPEELDGKRSPRSERLISGAINADTFGWVLNNAKLVSQNVNIKQQGNFEFTTRHNEPCIEAKEGMYGSVCNDYWYGPSYTRKVPADSNGQVGQKDCRYDWSHFFVIKGNQDLGMTQFVMTSGTGNNRKNVAAVTFGKMTQDNYRGFCKLTVNGKDVYQSEYSYGSEDTLANWDNGWSYIEKFGADITFKIGGGDGHIIYATYHDDALENVSVTEISFFMGAWSGMCIQNNGVRRVKFTAHKVNAWNDIPNKFSKDDYIRVDCGKQKVIANHIREPGLGAIGNEWEEFQITPGVNRIKCLYSNWAKEKKPIFSMNYKGVYL